MNHSLERDIVKDGVRRQESNIPVLLPIDLKDCGIPTRKFNFTVYNPSTNVWQGATNVAFSLFFRHIVSNETTEIGFYILPSGFPSWRVRRRKDKTTVILCILDEDILRLVGEWQYWVEITFTALTADVASRYISPTSSFIVEPNLFG